MERVCCMCGDVGFADKLFRCGHCRNRLQHSYCSNYYSEFAEPTDICDWCRSDERKQSSVARHGDSSSSKDFSSIKDECSSGSRVKHIKNRNDHVAKSVNAAGGGVPSPRTATRRYKLLKDVLC